MKISGAQWNKQNVSQVLFHRTAYLMGYYPQLAICKTEMLPMTPDSNPLCAAYIVLSGNRNQVANSSEVKYLLSSIEEVVIGREMTCQIAVNSEQYPTVSRHHAKVQPLVEGSKILWRICDLNAANGTYINGNRVQGCQNLHSGDRFMLSKDGPEFLFEYEVVSPSVPSEPIQSITSELSMTTEPISTPHSVPSPSQSCQPPTAPVTPPTQSVVASNTKVEENSLRSLWDLASEDKITVLSGYEDLVRTVAFSPDGKLLASGSADKTIRIWDITSKKEFQIFTGHKLAVSAVAFSPDGELLASGSADKTIRIWDLVSQENIQQLTGHGMGVNAVAFSPNGQLLASGSADKTIKIWNLPSGEVAQTLVGQKMGVNAAAFSPDAQLLASGSADRTVKLWKVESGEVFSTLPVLRSSINSLFFSPSGEVLAISTDDKMIRLWSLKLEQEIRVLSGYNWQTGGLAISRDGQMLACGSEDKTVKVWRL